MKWLGQHIWDLISRFRSDVYLDDLSTTTDTSILVVDSNNKINKNTTMNTAGAVKYSVYTWTFGGTSGDIDTHDMSIDTSRGTGKVIPTQSIVDAANSYIILDNIVAGNAGATIEIGITCPGSTHGYLATDTDFFMAPTAYNATPFTNYGMSIRGLSKMGRLAGDITLTLKIATATLTAGTISVYVAHTPY